MCIIYDAATPLVPVSVTSSISETVLPTLPWTGPHAPDPPEAVPLKSRVYANAPPASDRLTKFLAETEAAKGKTESEVINMIGGRSLETDKGDLKY